MKPLEEQDWDAVAEALDAEGWALLPGVLDGGERRALRASYAEPGRFRSRVVMQRHNFGRGEYQYFADPLPPLVLSLREQLYARLAPVARRWSGMLRAPVDYPARYADYRRQCHAAGQSRPTPLLLRYGPGDYNCLHQDLYGGIVFPMQVVFLLSEPGTEFDGGELVLVEQRPRMQSRPRVVPLRAGDAAVFAVRERPARGVHGYHRVQLRHGVSEVRSGQRFTLGIIFHDAA